MNTNYSWIQQNSQGAFLPLGIFGDIAEDRETLTPLVASRPRLSSGPTKSAKLKVRAPTRDIRAAKGDEALLLEGGEGEGLGGF